MDTIQEAIKELHSSELFNEGSLVSGHLDKARTLAMIAVAEQIERVADKLTKEQSEECPAKRMVITFNDETTRDQTNSLSVALTSIMDSLKITAVIVYDEGE